MSKELWCLFVLPLLVASLLPAPNKSSPALRNQAEPQYESSLNQNTFITVQTHTASSLMRSRTESDNYLPFCQAWKDEERPMTS